MNAPRQPAKPVAIPSYRPDGTVMDLADPQPSDIVWPEIAETLARTARWGGRPHGAPFSVAQHCVMGADALMAETGDRIAAAQFLLHDAHEAFLGDLQTPVQKLLDLHCRSEIGALAAIQIAKDDLDRIIFTRAGVPLPLHPAVRDMDARMARAEAGVLYGPAADAHAPGRSLPRVRLDPLRVWAWARAAEEWLNRFDRYVGRPVKPAGEEPAARSARPAGGPAGKARDAAREANR